MKNFILMAGAAALASAAPSLAKPGGGHGHAGHGTAHSSVQHGAKSHAKMHSARSASVKRSRLDRNRNGIADADEALARKYGGALCPPGLAKKTPACTPPGQAKRLFRDGQRVPSNYRSYTPYGDIPGVLVDRYDLTDQYRYIYRDNVIYVVDPQTSLIQRVINAIL